MAAADDQAASLVLPGDDPPPPGVSYIDLADLVVQGKGKNPRKHTPRNIDMIAASIQEVGTGRSIVIDENNEVLAGNGTVQAALQLGHTRLQVIDVPGDILTALRRSGMSGDGKTRLSLGDNRTGELSLWDNEVLATLKQQGLLDGLFYSGELDDVLKTNTSLDPRQLWNGMPEFDQDDIRSWKKLAVHFETREDYLAFCRLIGQQLTDDTRSCWYPAHKRTHRQEFTSDDTDDLQEYADAP